MRVERCTCHSHQRIVVVAHQGDLRGGAGNCATRESACDSGEIFANLRHIGAHGTATGSFGAFDKRGDETIEGQLQLIAYLLQFGHVV